MRKTISLLITLMLCAFMNAQTEGFGAKAGVNFADLNGDNFSDTKARVGLNLSVFYEYFVSEKFSLQPEIMYSMQGTKTDITENIDGYEGSFESEIKLDYIHLPILAKFYPIENLYVQAGPQIGFNISAKEKYEQMVNGEITDSYDGDIENIKSLDTAVVFGAGYKFMPQLGVDGRYMIGVSDVRENFDAMNSVLQLGLFFQF